GCCDVVNRGVAVYQGKVYEATFDGRLIALDAATGKLVWSTDTLPEGNHNYTITSAPLAANGKVIIGNGGAEYFGARGYVSAYDAQTGKLDWRWHTVPGDPDKPYENAAMKKAAKTWDPKTKYWKQGGGGTVWQSFSYDPKLDLLYFGTGNADPWDPNSRGGPEHDSLYTASIVALKLSTGKYVWHYQTTPADMSDYDTDQDLALTTLKIDGKNVPVIMNANKNGFFFVLDRRNGKFISADNFTPANWATGYTKDGKPILTGLGQSGKPFETIPGPYGAHNWQAASYSPETGLAYIPAQLIPLVMVPVGNDPESKDKAGGINSGNGWNTGMQLVGAGKTTPFGRLIAWNPVTQKQAWAHDYPAPWSGGTLATAGNLVFQATADGRLVAFNAQNGESRWESSLGQGAIAGPMTYSVDGTQYVTIAVGWGGAGGQSFSATDREGPGTVFTFALGGNATPPEFAKRQTAPLLSGVAYDPKDVAPGTALYVNNCAICHGTPGQNQGGSVPNLGY
ncbi:MAG: PQQ-binding-like beta-propeller repeat protein, partial [Marinobacter sp.]|nr:PQQ-binding-like beta-propeller repeat protein [Marinobacter sp.]